MNREALLRKILRKAGQDRRKRKDPRFLETLGFLVAKGFLRTNLRVRPMPNKRLRIDDALWAGAQVEPRILEVLPAAVLRLGRHFDLDRARHEDLARVIDQLRAGDERGDPFHGVPYEKVRFWANYPLRDKRVRPVASKKLVKTFRLDPVAVARLREMAVARNCTETEVVEGLLSG